MCVYGTRHSKQNADGAKATQREGQIKLTPEGYPGEDK